MLSQACAVGPSVPKEPGAERAFCGLGAIATLQRYRADCVFLLERKSRRQAAEPLRGAAQRAAALQRGCVARDLGVWAARGGFATLNKDVDPSIYPDEITRKTASAIGEAEIFRFDLSDLQPAAFGGTIGQGLFKLFQDYLANPRNVDGIADQMERAAARAFA